MTIEENLRSLYDDYINACRAAGLPFGKTTDMSAKDIVAHQALRAKLTWKQRIQMPLDRLAGKDTYWNDL